jgi:hypothetical protein
VSGDVSASKIDAEAAAERLDEDDKQRRNQHQPEEGEREAMSTMRVIGPSPMA